MNVTRRFLAAKGLITNSEGKFLVVREGVQYEEGTNVGKWDVPGGRLEINETLLDGLNREVGEETGLRVTIERLMDARENFPIIKGETVHIVRLYYLCKTDTDEVVLSDDHDMYAWITKEDLNNYALMDDVRDLITKLL